jgi:peptidylprolyl isomerase
MFEADDRLNGQYTVIGEVISGMEIVDTIRRGTGPNGMVTSQPDVMVSVRVIH